VFKFKSAPEVAIVPVASTMEPLDTNAKYPAVPVLPAVPFVMLFAVIVAVPAEAVADANAVDPNVNVASSVPVKAPFTDGWEPV